MELEELSDSLRRWAATKPLVNRLWIFGSRARGNNRPDSDLDIAVELDLSAGSGCDDGGGWATWAFETKTWRGELQDLCGLCVDLQQFDGVETPTIQAGLTQSSVLVYAKSAA